MVGSMLAMVESTEREKNLPNIYRGGGFLKQLVSLVNFRLGLEQLAPFRTVC